jgi:[protein-PII] uridylyltransferase
MPSSAPLTPQQSPLQRSSPHLADELKTYLSRHRALVEQMIRSAGPEAGLPAATRYSRTFDGLLCSLFKALESTLQSEGAWHPVTLAAVGSYGRGALGYHSDLDVRLLAPGRADKVRPIAEALLYPLWDAGLTIGHQVMSAGEVIDMARTDLPTATSLLDWRVLTGDRAPTEKLLARAFDGLFGPSTIQSFLDRLEAGATDRSERYGGSVYLLEPDVRNGIGGLRDFDIAHWAARARWRVNDLSELVKLGLLLPREWQQIEASVKLLWRVRNLLHVYAGRRSDRLSFDRQELLAQDLGYGPGGPGVEAFMSEYYQKARVIAQARELIIGRAAPPPKRRPREKPIGRGLKLTNEQVSLQDAAALESEPALALRLFDEAVRRDLPVYGFARDAVARAASSPAFCERLRDSDEARRLFVRLCTVIQRTKLRDGSVLRELHDLGLLVAMIPEFAPVVGRVHHDVYHVYTVDVHSVAALDRLRALSRGELAAEHPLASRLAAEISRLNVLVFATLLHDIGKDIGGKNHAERGRDLARVILARLGLPESDVTEVQALIEKHLRMYHVATRRDIDDPKTIESFCEEVHGREGLRELYLLTICDVSTTSPTALTSWKAKVLEELYVAAERQLSDGPGAHGSERLEKIRTEVRALCPERGEREFLDHFLAAMPERYLYANDAADIVRHSRFARQAQMKQVNVTVMTTNEPYVELGFIADDRPGLLAMITATLTAARFKVISAQVYSWVDQFGRLRALDLFWVRCGESADGVISGVPRLERDFSRLVGKELSPADLVTGGSRSRWSDRPTPKVQTEVSIDNRCATRHSVIEITTKDQLGLLFWLSNTLQHLDLQISLAKINTEGTQVADVFYVTDAEGAKVTEPERIEAIKSQILATVAHLEKATSS